MATISAGCGGLQLPVTAPGAMPESSRDASARTGVRIMTSSYRVVHTFSHTRDGGRPAGSLLDVNGMLYGTTQFGGAGSCYREAGTGCGTVYVLDPKSGRKKVLYSFRGGSSDGASPNGGLIDVNGTLYGTTTYGGGGCAYEGCGTVYSISPTGTETMLHSFHGQSDGQWPFAPLLNVNGTLYGTTAYGGGSCSCGTVYSISTGGSEKILYNFARKDDGDGPWAGLIDVNGTLYGTTLDGGSFGQGTVYSITTSGTEKVLYSFANSPDGANPTAGLIDVKGTLYGTTTTGGITGCQGVGQSGCGVVYSITTAGKEKVLYSFTPGQNAWYPSTGLVSMKGTMYGTTEAGGGGYGCGNEGCGIVYSITTMGYEAVLHVFSDSPDGASPDATMIDVQGTLYGATAGGGGGKCVYYEHQVGCGTIFALTP